MDSISDIIGDGGEGIILRKPSSSYEQTRSPNLLKLKVESMVFSEITRYRLREGIKKL